MNININKEEFINLAKEKEERIGKTNSGVEVHKDVTNITPYGKIFLRITAQVLGNDIVEIKVTDSYYGGPEVSIPMKITSVKGVFTRNYKFIREALKVEDFGYFIPEDGILTKVSVPEPEDHITLSNGRVLMNKFGKYMPNLCFISDIPHLPWEDVKSQDFNLDKGDLSVLRGTFFISKKGTQCFKIEENGPHILLRDNWGGAFSKYRGRTLPEEGAIYYKRASSNGGGNGYDYAIYPANWQYTLSEEDI